MKTEVVRKTEASTRRWTTIALPIDEADQAILDSFFERNRQIKKGDYYRDAIIEKIHREEALARERQAVADGRTQIDPALLGDR